MLNKILTPFLTQKMSFFFFFFKEKNSFGKPFINRSFHIYIYIYGDKVFLQISLERNPLNLSYIYIYIYILMNVNFENLSIRLHFLYALNKHVKFHLNRMLFTIQSINLFFVHNFLSQKLEI